MQMSPETLIAQSVPFAQYQVVDVEFPSTADSDLIVRHGLDVKNPYDVQFTVLKQYQPGSVYEDDTIDKRPWQLGYVVLRSDTASWRGRLLLSVLRAGVSQTANRRT